MFDSINASQAKQAHRGVNCHILPLLSVREDFTEFFPRKHFTTYTMFDAEMVHIHPGKI